MTTTKQGPMTARVATGGGSGGSAIKTASNGITPLISSTGRRDTPRDTWATVTAAEIGAGYEPIELVTQQSLAKRLAKSDPVWHNQFIKGTSKFIWFWVEQKVVKPKKVSREPINFKNKLDKKTRRRFANALNSNIDATANFILKDLLPISLSLMSGISKADELVQQLVDEAVQLPVDYLRGKQTMAMNLRVIRFVSESFALNEEERKLMALEYTRPWSQT